MAAAVGGVAGRAAARRAGARGAARPRGRAAAAGRAAGARRAPRGAVLARAVSEPSTSGDGGAGGSDGGLKGTGGGGGGGGDGDDEEGWEGEPMAWEDVQALCKRKDVALPADMAEYAQSGQLREGMVRRYIALWDSGAFGRWAAGWAPLRDRLIADTRFVFKVVCEVAIDSGCATIAEVQKRGEEFWKEFDLFVSDLLVGLALDVALVGLLAPVAATAAAPAALAGAGRVAAFKRWTAALPASCFEKAPVGASYTLGQRVATYFVKGGQYFVAGGVCGIVGQGGANALITAKRRMMGTEGSEDEVPLPPVLKTALVWGLFMAFSSNTRYMLVNGFERVVEGSAVAQAVPAVSNVATVGVRLANNIVGGMHFIDMARDFGVQ